MVERETEKKAAKGDKLTNANVAKEPSCATETVNAGFEGSTPLGYCFEDGYESYTCMEVADSSDAPLESWSGIWDETSMTLAHTLDPDITKAGNKQSCATICAPLPYCIDSGCTSHVLPVCSDFRDLMSIPHHAVCGMDGKSIPAIGVGTILLHCGKGRWLALKNALFVLDAALHLISVGKLADDGLVTTFGDQVCHLHNKSGRTIADGARKGNGLYYISGGDPKIIEHRLIAHASPDLATWHRRLGHVNYASIIRMAKKSFATGMPVNLSMLPPSVNIV